jgi:hypothetical protein
MNLDFTVVVSLDSPNGGAVEAQRRCRPNDGAVEADGSWGGISGAVVARGGGPRPVLGFFFFF